MKIKGKWAYLYRAVDKESHTIDFLLPPQRDQDAAEAFLRKAIRNQLIPDKITIDQSGSNPAAIKRYNWTHKTDIAIRQCKYLNYIVEQDHRTVKRKVRPMSGPWMIRTAVGEANRGNKLRPKTGHDPMPLALSQSFVPLLLSHRAMPLS